MNADLDTFIYMTISEVCFGIYDSTDKNTKFPNYNGWCKHLEGMLACPTSDKHSALHDIFKIVKELKILYGLTFEESTIYVNNFFIDGLWVNYMLLTKYRREQYGKRFF